MYSKVKLAGHPVLFWLNVTALGLFLAAMASYVADWNGPAVSATLGVVLSAIGATVTVAAGFLGWTLVQGYHVDVHLVPEQKPAEPAVQHSHLSLLPRHAA